MPRALPTAPAPTETANEEGTTLPFLRDPEQLRRRFLLSVVLGPPPSRRPKPR